MSTAGAELVLRHLRGLRAEQDIADSVLLGRFAAGREEEAFAALVRRHGPMVMGVCRRVLGNAHDAEDAFQAAFLALALRAGSLRSGEAVAGWLYRVACRAALKARKQAQRRRRQQERPIDVPADPLEEMSGRELLAVVDEEVQALPERWRNPLVLCYLLGQTRDQAAGQVGCSLSTLNRRVEEGKEKLRRRLQQRGLSMSAVLLAIAAVPAVVPQALAAAVTRAAVRAAAPAVGKVAMLTAGLVALGLVAGTVGLGAVAPPAAPAQPAATPTQKQSTPPAAPAKKDEPQMISGRALDETGKALADVEVVVLGLAVKSAQHGVRLLEHSVLGKAKSDAEGRFRLSVASDDRGRFAELHVLAGKAAHGLVLERAIEGRDLELRLPPEKVIRGRLLDLQGEPAVGVRVEVNWLHTGTDRDIDDTRFGALPANRFSAWPATVQSGKDGRFIIRGLSPRMGGYLHMSAENYAPHYVEIKTGDKVQEVNATLPPAQVLEGVVTAKDTGKPIPNAYLMINGDQNEDAPEAMGGGVDGHADDKGRFRLSLPSAKLYTIHVNAPEGQPYLREAITFRWPKGATRRDEKIVLKRGVLVHGKLTETGSGKPVAGAIVHNANSLWVHYQKSGPDGAFHFVVPPGKGHFLVKGPGNDYIALQLSDGELRGNGKPSGYRLYPDAVIPFEAKVGQEALEVKALLRRGVTIRGRALDPTGKPAEGVLFCWNQLRPDVASWFGAAVAFRDGRFELHGCDPELTYPVSFLDARNKWGATVQVSARNTDEKPLTVRLAACGSAAVRYVDKQGKPLPKFAPIFYVMARPPEGKLLADSDFVANVDRVNYSGGGGQPADADGKASFAVLIPGTTYRILDYNLRSAKDFSVKPGERLDLGNVVIDNPGK